MKKNDGSIAKRPCIYVDWMESRQRTRDNSGMHYQGTNGPLDPEAARGNPHEQSQPTRQDEPTKQEFQHGKERHNR